MGGQTSLGEIQEGQRAGREIGVWGGSEMPQGVVNDSFKTQNWKPGLSAPDPMLFPLYQQEDESQV